MRLFKLFIVLSLGLAATSAHAVCSHQSGVGIGKSTNPTLQAGSQGQSGSQSQTATK